MADERMAKDSAVLDEAADRVIREMTEVQMSDDTVARVMARVRAASHAKDMERGAGRLAAGGWLAALLEPRVSWGTATAAAALAAILAAGATLAIVRNGGRDGDRVRGGSIASTASKATVVPAAMAATTSAPPTMTTTATATTNAAASAPRPAAATPIVTPVKRARGLNTTRGAGGLNETVIATIVATPDEEPSRAQQGSATRTTAPPVSAAGPAPSDIRLDITITDRSGTAKPIAKTVSMIVADRESGSVRSETRVPFQHEPVKSAAGNSTVERWETENLPLNVDVWPTILSDGHVRVRLVVSYRTASQAKALSNEPLATASVTKNLITVLTDGKPLIVSESADAATDRKVTLELKATIQK